MIRIRKGLEPAVLQGYRQRPPPPDRTYEDFDGKRELCEVLWREQRGLCCYCMGRIEDLTTATIEHWRPQVGSSILDLEWKNLFAVCHGSRTRRLREQHCDARKRDRDIKVNPLSSVNLEQLIHYTNTGYVSSTVDEWNRDIDSTLNLNCKALLIARSAALDGFIRNLRVRLGDGHWTRSKIDEEIRRLDNREDPPGFLGFVRWFLLERRARAE